MRLNVASCNGLALGCVTKAAPVINAKHLVGCQNGLKLTRWVLGYKLLGPVRIRMEAQVDSE